MKKTLTSFFLICLLFNISLAQDNQTTKRPKALGVSFFFNDYTTPQRIRNSAIENVLREDNWASISDMAPGLGLTYISGLRKWLDFAGSLSASYVNYPVANKT